MSSLVAAAPPLHHLAPTFELAYSRRVA